MKYYLTELSDIIRNRRSIKPEHFNSRPIDKETLSALLENAKWAPTHGLTQPWRFTVFIGEGLAVLSDFQCETYKELAGKDKYNQKIYDKLKARPYLASAVIAIGMKRQASGKIPEIEEVQAVACAVQNMFLTATAMGIAAYWTTGGLTYKDEMNTFLGLEEADKCLGLFYLGNYDGEMPTSKRKEENYFVKWVTG